MHKIKNIALFLVHIDDIEYGYGTTIPLRTFGLCKTPNTLAHIDEMVGHALGVLRQ